MARKGSKATGRLARNLAIGTAVAGLIGGLLVAVALVQNLSSGIEDPAIVARGWKVGLGMTILVAAITGGAGWVLGG